MRLRSFETVRARVYEVLINKRKPALVYLRKEHVITVCLKAKANTFLSCCRTITTLGLEIFHVTLISQYMSQHYLEPR